MDFHPANFGLSRAFRSRVRSRHGADRQTDTALTDGDDVVAHTSVAVGGSSSLSLLVLMSGRSASACAEAVTAGAQKL